jgi:hypothetical protein
LSRDQKRHKNGCETMQPRNQWDCWLWTAVTWSATLSFWHTHKTNQQTTQRRRDMQPGVLMEPNLQRHTYALIFLHAPSVPDELGGLGYIGSLHRQWIRTFNIVMEIKNKINKI